MGLPAEEVRASSLLGADGYNETWGKHASCRPIGEHQNRIEYDSPSKEDLAQLNRKRDATIAKFKWSIDAFLL